MNRRKFNSLLAGLGASSVLPLASGLGDATPVVGSPNPYSASESAAEPKLSGASWYRGLQLFVSFR
jgi:hypothetical protein